MEWAKGLEVDDEDIRAMRKRFFDSYTQELKDLLEKTKAVKAKVLPEEPKKPEAEEPKDLPLLQKSHMPHQQNHQRRLPRVKSQLCLLLQLPRAT